MFLIANAGFIILYAGQLRIILADTILRDQAALVVFINLLWGFHQELAYRGILQTELARGWGPLLGVLESS